MAVSVEMKQCVRCKLFKPLSPEYFRRTIRTKTGYHAACKECLKKAEIEHARRNGIQSKNKIIGGTKGCKKCERVLPLEDFSKDKNRKDGISCYCRECSSKLSKEYVERNIESVRAKSKQRHLNNREKNNKRSSSWYKNNKSRVSTYRMANREQATIKNRQWRKSHPDAVKVMNMRRRARRLGLPNEFGQQEWEFALSYFNHRCAVCGRGETEHLTIVADHWIPLSASIENNPGSTAMNMIPLCHGRGSCNLQKRAQYPKEWLSHWYSKQDVDAILGWIENYFKVVQDGCE